QGAGRHRPQRSEERRPHRPAATARLVDAPPTPRRRANRSRPVPHPPQGGPVSDAEATKDALGADVALPINCETVYALRQQVATLTAERDNARETSRLTDEQLDYLRERLTAAET